MHPTINRDPSMLHNTYCVQLCSSALRLDLDGVVRLRHWLLFPNAKCHLAVNCHGSCFLRYGLDYAFGSPIHMVSVRRAWFVWYTISSEPQPEGLVVLFSTAMIAWKSIDFKFPGISLGLNWLVGSDACFLLDIWEDTEGDVLCVIVDELDELAMARGRRYGEWYTHIQLYKLKWLCCALGLDCNGLMQVLRMDTGGVHGVVICIHITNTLLGNKIMLGLTVIPLS